MLDDLGLGDHGGISLGIDQYLADHQAYGGIIKFELHCPSLEILRKTIPQFIVLRGQSDGQLRFHHGLHGLPLPKLLGDGKQAEDKEPLVLGLVPHIGDPLTGQSPEGAAKLQHIGLHRGLHGIIRQSRGKDKARGLDGGIAMVDCK